VVSQSKGIQRVSGDIGPDIASINHGQASLTIHNDADYNWLVLCDGAAGKLRVLDLDTMMWMVPWPVSSITTVYSGETAAGTHKLFLGRGGHPLAMNYSSYQDEGSSYTASLTLGLISLLDPDRPEQVAVIEYIGLERNSIDITTVKYLLDEDPLQGTPTYSTASTADSPFLRYTTGTNLIEKWYYVRDKAGARRVSIQFNWAAANTNFKLNTITLASSRQGDS
jgi:hypothetical protein